MKIFHQVKAFLAVAMVAILSALIGSGSAVAVDEVPEYRIQITPARDDIGDLKPGEKYTGTFKVQNTGKNEFEFKVNISPYSVIDENYSPDYDTKNEYTDIAGWIKFSQDSGTIAPNGEAEIAYTISVPADVAAGGQYAVLSAEIVSKENLTGQSSGISVNGRVGMLLYSNIAGNTRKTGSIIENKISGILFNPPVSGSSIVENTGNTHARATYSLEVYPLFGDEEVYTNAEEPDTLIILPDTRRLNTITWPGSPYLGIFRVKQTVTIFDQTSTTEKLVFLCPIWLIFIILLIIFCVIFWIISRIRNRNK